MKVYVDLRCLQDPHYSFRGIGLHTASVLRHARTFLPERTELVGLLDDALPPLPDVYRDLTDRIGRARSVGAGCGPALFLQPSPMTHDPAVMGGLVNDRRVVSAALVYDFIPLDFADAYLRTPSERRGYLANLYWLKRHHLFCPISDYSARRLREIVGVPAAAVAVTGASVREAFSRFDAAQMSQTPHRSRFAAGDYFLMVGGNDERKNTRAALLAHAELVARRGKSIGLVVVGHYLPDYRTALLQAYLDAGGRRDRVEFAEAISDAELAALYHRAIALVCPSRVEGFSLPVVEAMACGCPVVAASNDAHRELVRQPEALFAPDDVRGAAAAMERLLNAAARQQLLQAQASVAEQFRPEEVARLVWQHLTRRLPTLAPAVLRGQQRQPRLALLSPYPPDRSGVADYTAQTLKSLTKHASIDVYTDAAPPRRDPWVRAFHPISELPYLRDEYDRTIAILGNSTFHTRILDYHQRRGGPCLLHDTRLTDFYVARFGLPGFAERASRLLGRVVTAEDVLDWLHNPALLPALFLDEVVARGEPVMVHSRRAQQEVQHRYGVPVTRLPFCCYRPMAEAELTDDRRRAARTSLGVPNNRLLIASFGIVSPVKGALECIHAIDLLRAAGVAAELHFVGDAGGCRPEVERLIAALALGDHVRVLDRWVSDAEYQNYLLGSDYAVQVRRHGFGALSGAVMDCLSAGLPTVVNADMAEALEAPAYVLAVPDELHPAPIADRLVEAARAGLHRERITAIRREYLDTHSFDRYVVEMMRAIGLAA